MPPSVPAQPEKLATRAEVIAPPVQTPPAPTLAAVPAQVAPPTPVVRVVPDENDRADTPIGEWQTGGKDGSVRIEACGASLCGYVLDGSRGAKGETVLVNMKPKKDNEWAGNVYSRSSGNSYYGTMTLKDADTLRVEACALGAYFCSANSWTRVWPTRSTPPLQHLAHS
jgi:hypothetical protein